MTSKMLAVVTATVANEQEHELIEAFGGMAESGDKPDGLERSELFRGRDGQWIIQSLWRDRDAMAAARRGGRRPAALELLDRLEAAHTHELFVLEATT